MNDGILERIEASLAEISARLERLERDSPRRDDAQPSVRHEFEMGRRLAEARMACALSLRSVEEQVGVSASTLSRHEREPRSMRVGTLLDLAGLYEVDPAWLLTGETR